MSDRIRPAAAEDAVTTIVTSLLAMSEASDRTQFIAIDGPSGSGKTTFAGELARELQRRSATVVSIALDDLYEGWEGLRSPQFESHLETWIVLPLRYGLGVHHPVYDWEAECFVEWQIHPVADFLIVEGVGALLPPLANAAQCRVWLSASMDTVTRRLATRPGPNPEDWWPRWQSQESVYFREQEPWKIADWDIQMDD